MTSVKKKKKKVLIDKILHEVYYNYGGEGALQNNPAKLLRLIKNKGYVSANIQQVKEFLSKQPSYTVHHRAPSRQYPHRKIHVAANHVRIDADLIELRDIAKWNDGYQYILVLIDAFSRFVWAHPIKNKDANTTARALESLIENNNDLQTILLYTDAGKEFIGAPFQGVLKKNSWLHRICTSDDFHCPFVERVIRTIKEKMFQAMTAQYTRRWLDLLPKIINTYNHTSHSSTGLSPYQAKQPENYLHVMKRVVPMHPTHKNAMPKYNYQKGDLVRILKSKSAFDKGYLPRFTWEIFRIHKRANDRPHDQHAVPAYILEDLQGELIEHAVFYEPELVRVHADQLQGPAPIKEILAQRGDKIKVWFQGYPKKDAMWISRQQIV